MPRGSILMSSARSGLVVAVMSMLSAPLAHAQSGGLYLPENGGPVNGTALAGSAAQARNAETALLNPAGMTRLEHVEVLVSLMPSYFQFEFDSSSDSTVNGSDGGNQVGFLPAAGLFIAAPINEHAAVGLSISSPAGLILDPDDDWVGRTVMSRAQLVALNIEPSAGVRFSRHLSAGFGVSIQYLTFEQELRGPILDSEFSIDGDDWTVGLLASLLWEPLDTTRFGLRFRSAVNHELSGDLTVTEGRTTGTSFTLPMSLTLSAYHELTEAVALMMDVGWTDWSAFDYNIISFEESGASISIPRNFKDTFNVSVGVHIAPARNWLFMLGGGYTSTPVDDEDRTVDLPADQQVRGAGGVEYTVNDSWTLGGNYSFLWLGTNDIDQMVILGRVNGSYDAFGHLFGLHVSARL